MKKRKHVCICAAVAAGILICSFGIAAHLSVHRHQNGPQQQFRAMGKEIQICEDGQWNRFPVKGVNIGSGYPGAFPNHSYISEETYLRWLEMIGDMNANTIRVYQLQVPEFYSALLKYNENHEKKLYLIQTANFPEKMMFSEKNILDPSVQEPLFAQTHQMIDAIHGKKIAMDWETGNLECYTADVSPYVLGYILGVEWDSVFVEYNCRLNSDVQGYDGTYLSCGEDASPFEVFLAQWGESTLSYEEEHYDFQRMIAFSNWAETDPFVNEVHMELKPKNAKAPMHPYEEVVVDTERIHSTDRMSAGFFAAYNVYPYYPLFLQYGPYTDYVDDTGNRNPYRKYLTELNEHHSCPVVITEYGVPTSRSAAFHDRWRGFSHGGLNETEQAQALTTLYEDIQKAGCAGSLVFSWQDEWYKRAWNEMAFSDPDGRAYWSNMQCVEQRFGLLSFDPGSADANCYPDGDLSEWSAKDRIAENDGLSLSMQSDEEYVYLLAEGIDPETDVNIALDVTPKSGSSKAGNTEFQRPVDFIIQISSDNGCKLYVEEHYDMLPYYLFSTYQDTPAGVVELDKMKDTFQRVVDILPGCSKFRLVSRVEDRTFRNSHLVASVGCLIEGNGNPESSDYDSNADYYRSGDAVEIRIPWQLLNFYNPAKCEIVDDMEQNNDQIRGMKIHGIYGAIYPKDAAEAADFGMYHLKSWDMPTWHERPKQAYFAMQKVFGGSK